LNWKSLNFGIAYLAISPFAFPKFQNCKNFPFFWDGKGNGKLNSAKF